MARRERMSAVDTAWLRMDRPTNLMMIVGVMVFDHRVDFDRLRDTIEARLVARYRRFRQCAVQEVAGAFWQDDPDFSMDAHLRRRALPTGAGKKELQKLASELAVQPLNPASPCGASTSSRTTKADRRWSSASTTALRTALPWWA